MCCYCPLYGSKEFYLNIPEYIDLIDFVNSNNTPLIKSAVKH
jgi:hypothetical protein